MGDVSTIDQIDIFRQMPNSQKQTKKEPNALSIK